MTTVADVMTRTVLTVTPETQVREVAQLLYSKHISGVPVVDADGTVVGIVSESDLMGHVAAIGDAEPRRRSWLTVLLGGEGDADRYSKAHGRTAADVMTRTIHTTTEDATLAAAVKQMERHRLKRLPVLRDGRLVGIVSRRDMLRVLATSAEVPPVRADDRTIRDALMEELRGQAWVTLTNKNIIVDKGIVHLFGSVESEAERQAVVAAAQSAPGVTGVEDHLSLALHLPI